MALYVQSCTDFKTWNKVNWLRNITYQNKDIDLTVCLLVRANDKNYVRFASHHVPISNHQTMLFGILSVTWEIKKHHASSLLLVRTNGQKYRDYISNQVPISKHDTTSFGI